MADGHTELIFPHTEVVYRPQRYSRLLRVDWDKHYGRMPKTVDATTVLQQRIARALDWIWSAWADRWGNVVVETDVTYQVTRDGLRAYGIAWVFPLVLPDHRDIVRAYAHDHRGVIREVRALARVS